MENLNNNDSIEKGIVLLKSALKKYEQGDIEHAEKDRELANDYFNKAKKEEEIDIALYGENRNFGIIYNILEENVKNALKENKNTKFVGSFVRLIKEDRILREQFKIYEAFCNKTIKGDIEEYINEAVNITPIFSLKKLATANEKLIHLIKNNKLNEFVEISDEKVKLYESVEYILLHKKDYNSIENFNNCKKIIKENIIKNNENSTFSKEKINENKYKSDLNNVINKHIQQLNEDEINLMEELCNTDKEKTFNKYKEETLNFISEQISMTLDASDKIDWNNVYNKVNAKKYNENTLLEDVSSFINIQNIIEE